MQHGSRKGSAKVAGLQRRIAKETSWLEQVAIRHDDPDAVLNDKGKPIPLRQAMDIEGVTFAHSGTPLAIDHIVNAFNVIANCSAKLSKLL